MARFRNSISLSVITHAVLFALLLWLAGERAKHAPAPRSLTWIEVEPLPKKSATRDDAQTRVVQTKQVEKSDKAAPNAFLGAQTQVVDMQTVSRDQSTKQGRTKTAKAEEQRRAQATPAKPAQVTPQVAPIGGVMSKLGVAIIPKSATQPQQERVDRTASFDGGEGGVPQDYIKGLKEFETTALNTKEYMFYGYFQRIRERLDRAWGSTLREKLTKIYYAGRRLANEMDHTTKVMVTLNSLGEITRVQVMEESGTRDLDDAAVKAFNLAGPFPNPPKGILNPEGIISIRWEFILRT